MIAVIVLVIQCKYSLFAVADLPGKLRRVKPSHPAPLKNNHLHHKTKLKVSNNFVLSRITIGETN